MVRKTDNKPIDKANEPLPPGARSFSRTGDGLTSFVEGETIRGKFKGVKEVNIRDRRSTVPGTRKDIRIYMLDLADGTTARIGSRTLLDDAFDEVCAAVGGWERLVGKDIAFVRGEDIETEDHNQLGTYTIILY